jgi:hypothetical protein
MSTRAVITFKGCGEQFHVFQHSDGRPAGILVNLIRATATAWPLPRFEPAQFAASFIHAGIQQHVEYFGRIGERFPSELGNGGMSITTGPEAYNNLEWAYEVRVSSFKLVVTAKTVDRQRRVTKFEGTIDEFKAYAMT